LEAAVSHPFMLDRRSEPDARAVMEDEYLDRGLPVTRLGVAIDIIADICGTDAADAVDAVGVGVGVDNDVDDVFDDNNAAYIGASDADADANAVDIRRIVFVWLTGGLSMENGLKVVMLAGAYGYSVTRVGWLRRVSGDEWLLEAGARTVIRTGERRGLEHLAIEGPDSGYHLLAPGGAAEHIHRLLIRRALPANEAAWIEHCPKPRDWNER